MAVLTMVAWTCCGGISVVVTGVETKLKLRGKKQYHLFSYSWAK